MGKSYNSALNMSMSYLSIHLSLHLFTRSFKAIGENFSWHYEYVAGILIFLKARNCIFFYALLWQNFCARVGMEGNKNEMALVHARTSRVVIIPIEDTGVMCC